jgi:hypothetical protein
MKRFFYFLPIFLMACDNPFYYESYESPEDVVSITVTEPLKRLYKYGEAFDKAGLSVKVFLRNGRSYDEKSPKVSGFDSTREGMQTVTVSAGGKTYSFVIGVMLLALNPTYQGISVSKGGSVTLSSENGAEGSWGVYIFKDRAFEDEPKLGARVSDRAVFAAPTGEGAYTVAATFRVKGVTLCRFYPLSVTP